MGNSASSLPFSIGKQISTTSDGCWEIHEGSRKSDGSAVSVFVAKKPSLVKPSGQATQRKPLLQPAIHHFTHCKKLRHPHILQVEATLDTDHPSDATGGGAGGAGGGGGSSGSTNASTAASETGDFIIVTEPCMSFEAWLQSRPDPEALAWGLESIVRALHFLHASANLAHGNISPDSFCVTPAGDVKLWNFSLVTTAELSQHFKEWEGVLTPSQYRSPERIEQRWDALSAAGIHAMDSYALGLLIPHVFGGVTPQPLVKAVQRLQTPNLRMRPRLQPLLKCPVFDTPYQKLQLQLEEFTVAPVENRIQFWQNLTPNLQAGLIPQFLAVHKLFPIMKDSIQTICNSDSMKSQDLYRREVAAIVQPLFYIAENYLGDKVGKELTTTVATLFAVNDRGVRGLLLQKAPLLANNLDKNSLNSSVFEPMCSGFNDSSAALRELTLKATLILVPHLTAPNLEKLSRYLVRMQSDPEASIRTNTVIFFCKLAPHLSEITREKLLLSALIRAMNDPFTPCRIAALQSCLKSKEFFDPKGIASKVLPAVTPQLLDSSAEVRREAFHIIDDLLFVLRQESERMAEMAAQQNQGQAQQHQQQHQQSTIRQPPASAPAQPVAAAPSSGGYLSSLSSWALSSTKATPAPAAPAPAAAPPVVQPPPASAPMPAAGQNLNAAAQITDVSDGWGDEDDGWGDDDDGIGISAPAPAPTVSKPSMNAFSSPPMDDDPFAAFDSKPAVRAVSLSKTAGSGSRGKLAIPSKKKPTTSAAPKPAVTKLQTDDVSDGWDDF